MRSIFILLTASANPADLDIRWEAYKERFGKKYDAKIDEEKAFATFSANDQFIEQHNRQGLSWTLAHNLFSDMSWVEFRARHLGLAINPTGTKNYPADVFEGIKFDESVDWVEKGAVTEVKNQLRCGSCWAFSTTGAIEGAYQIAGNPLTQFSEQELVACDNNSSGHGGLDNGCHGGLMDNAFKWIETNGLCTENAYPYTSGNGTSPSCAMSSCSPAVSVTGFMDVKDETGMIPAISIGPVSVAIEADKSFQFYHSGVLDNSGCGKQLDHGVLVVGYGTDGNQTYYKVKNSWGDMWGDHGYVRIVRGKDMCGIADAASYPVGVKPYGPSPSPVTPTPAPGTPTPPPSPAPVPTPAVPTPAPASFYACEPRKKICVPDSKSVFTKLECEDKCK